MMTSVAVPMPNAVQQVEAGLEHLRAALEEMTSLQVSAWKHS